MGAQPAKPSKKSRLEDDRTRREETFAEATSKRGSIDAMTTVEDWDPSDIWDFSDHRPNSSKSKRGVPHEVHNHQKPALRPVYEIGSYVMARWRNNYEYLAEVLAYRQRSREHLEYRIKFSWDGVVEWTPASSIRRAEQSEINYVLRFIRQHRQAETTKKEPSEERERKPVVDANDGSNDTPVAKGDMLYDRNIAQFHEACRKRRELKKQAVSGEFEGSKLEEPPKLENPTVSPPNKPGGKSEQPSLAKRSSATCPHCPRKMRRQSLLTAHLQNYHSAKSTSPQPTVELTPAPKKRKVEPEVEGQPLPAAAQSERYVFCPACKFSGSTTELVQNLIQCVVCRVWSHRACTSQGAAKSWICTFCHRAPSRSGLTDWPTESAETGEVTMSQPGDNPSLAHLMRETMSLITWLRHLNTLIVTGRRTLSRIRGSSGSGDSGNGEAQSTVATSNAPKENSADSTTADLTMDFPFIPAPQVVAGEEHLSALESTDITRILANLANSSPEDLPDLMTAISDDLLNVPASTQQGQPPAQVQSGSPRQTAAPPPPPQSGAIFDTPTKTLLASLEQVLYQGGSGLSNSKPFPPPTATTIEADLQRPLTIDAASPFFTTPVKSLRSGSTSVSDIEAAASLIGFAESSSRAEFENSVDPLFQAKLQILSSAHFLFPSSGSYDQIGASRTMEASFRRLFIFVDEAKSQRASSDLDCLESDILIPLEEMISLIESRLDVIESQVAKLQGNQATALPHSNAENRDGMDEGDGDDGDSVSALSRTPAFSHSSLSPSSSRSLSPTSPQEGGGGDAQSTGMSQAEDALEKDPPQREASLNNATSPPTDAELHPEEVHDLTNTATSAPKRKRHRRKWRSSEPDFEETCNAKEDEPFVAIHQPFHRIVFDEDGNASDVVLRPQCEVNRKHQKRLATSSYRWSSSIQSEDNTISAVPKEPKTSSLLPAVKCAVDHPEVKNLEVRVHHFPVNYSPPDDNVKTYTAVNQDDTREDNETIVERSDNTNEKD
ncbi:glutamate receptor AMPA [Echinococcus granulosus]|uniref:Glutamate receptor AMPA n=1 Tax=Echinococcus granulosus TaxID=6210 RepID=W6UMU0_ECHGR|nr:glutamate receptor AMPA [Echinococcus granulosus]EUB62383.1 glutamate receptor AMPA [Echinococcus granulosus]